MIIAVRVADYTVLKKPFFYSRYIHKTNVKTYNHQVRISYHTGR